MDELFKTVTFGGYDKEEVLEFLNNKFNDLELENEEKQKNLLDNKIEIETLKNRLLDYEEKLAALMVENKRLVDIITNHENRIDKDYTQSQLISTLVSAQQLSETIVKNAEAKSKQIINIANHKAFKELKFKTNADETLKKYEERYNKLIDNIYDASSITSTLISALNDIDSNLKEMTNNITKEISDVNKYE